MKIDVCRCGEMHTFGAVQMARGEDLEMGWRRIALFLVV
jgi:hypothetical protein